MGTYLLGTIPKVLFAWQSILTLGSAEIDAGTGPAQVSNGKQRGEWNVEEQGSVEPRAAP
ncbi:uncharacterized protein N7483_012732 [Penicillium malachiteum]|uniref:uncharacterized protein n=1 Tax=Penicillium malachiteum TaxID=1324776 RepID=UPI002547BD61|nr:uncharacterized protein N7483_012732 [Penicillium malachiteum]KAJ5715551.1 hypothetical protein N7483_012732 [Penicillium malachiteum]